MGLYDAPPDPAFLDQMKKALADGTINVSDFGPTGNGTSVPPVVAPTLSTLPAPKMTQALPGQSGPLGQIQVPDNSEAIATQRGDIARLGGVSADATNDYLRMASAGVKRLQGAQDKFNKVAADNQGDQLSDLALNFSKLLAMGGARTNAGMVLNGMDMYAPTKLVQGNIDQMIQQNVANRKQAVENAKVAFDQSKAIYDAQDAAGKARMEGQLKVNEQTLNAAQRNLEDALRDQQNRSQISTTAATAAQQANTAAAQMQVQREGQQIQRESNSITAARVAMENLLTKQQIEDLQRGYNPLGTLDMGGIKIPTVQKKSTGEVFAVTGEGMVPMSSAIGQAAARSAAPAGVSAGTGAAPAAVTPEAAADSPAPAGAIATPPAAAAPPSTTQTGAATTAPATGLAASVGRMADQAAAMKRQQELATDVKPIQASADSAASAQAQLRELERMGPTILKAPQTDADWIDWAARLKAVTGLSPYTDEQLNNAQVAQKYVTQMMQQMMHETKGVRWGIQETQAMQKGFPNLLQSPEARAKVLDGMKEMARAQINRHADLMKDMNSPDFKSYAQWADKWGRERAATAGLPRDAAGNPIQPDSGSATVVRTGTFNGKKVQQMSDGSIVYGD